MKKSYVLYRLTAKQDSRASIQQQRCWGTFSKRSRHRQRKARVLQTSLGTNQGSQRQSHFEAERGISYMDLASGII